MYCKRIFLTRRVLSIYFVFPAHKKFDQNRALDFKFIKSQWFSVVYTLIDNGKLADQVAKFLPVVVKKFFFRRFGV